MKEILEAILAGDTTTEAFAALPVPTTYTAVTVHRDEQEMFAGMDPGTRTRDGRCTSRRCPRPSSARARRWSR